MNKFIKHLEQINYTNELETFKNNYYKKTHVVKLLLGSIKAIINHYFSKSSNENYPIIADVPHMTKLTPMTSLLNDLDKRNIRHLLTIQNDENERTKEFIKELRELNQDYFLNIKPQADLYFIKFLLSLYFQRKSNLEVCFSYTLYLYIFKYYSILKKTNAHILFTANEDNYMSPTLSQICKLLNVKTVNFMHGRGYLTNQYYDISLVSGQHQIDFFKQNTKGETNFYVYSQLMNQYKNVPIQGQAILKERKKIKILFYDQFITPLYSLEMRKKVLNFLKFSSEAFNDVEIYVKHHPAAPLEQKKEMEREFKKFDSTITSSFDLALTVFSTSCFESVLQYHTPIFLINVDNICHQFSQLFCFKKYYLKTEQELQQIIENLKNNENSFKQLLDEQIRDIENEFASSLSNEEVINLILS